MPVKLRLRRQGRRKSPHYAIVAADARSPRDGRFIEKIGTYNPIQKPAHVYVNHEAAIKWLQNGAQPTHTVRSLLRHAGVTLRYALIKQGKSEDQIERIYGRWLDEKRSKKFKKVVMVDIHGKLLETIGEMPTPTKTKTDTPITEVPVKESGEGEAEATPEAEVEAPAVEEAPAAEETAEVEETPEAEAPAEEEAPAVEETPEAEAEAPAEEETPAEEPAAEADDLKKIEGIGPKIAEILNGAGITTFAKLGESDADKIREILAEAGDRYKSHDPTTWPKQASMAAAGNWDELKKWQDELDGGRIVSEEG